MSFVFYAQAHDTISATHPTTLEITKDDRLTQRGDCIVAVKSSKGLCDLPPALKRVLSTPDGMARLTVRVGMVSFSLEGRGAQGLTFSDPAEIVVRKSGFVSDRTLMVLANRGAGDIPREMVKLLQDPKNRVTIEISVLTNAGLP